MIRIGAKGWWLAAGSWAAWTALLLLAPGFLFAGEGRLPPIAAELLAWAVHLVLFWVLARLTRRALRATGAAERRLAASLVAMAAYCVGLELLQIAVPERGFQLLDIVFGWLGIWLGWARGRTDRIGALYSRTVR